jgi:hypothetical protein
MSKLYKNGRLELYLDTGTDLADANYAKIKAKSPSGIITEVDATIQLDNRTIYHYYPSWILNESGTWAFWSKVVFNDTNFNIGEPVLRQIYEETM